MVGLNKIAKMRKFKGITQEDMAKKFGISLQAYWRKEKGLVPFNDFEKLKIIEIFKSDFPKITIEDIFFSE